jgi:hypothetical protein
MKKDEPKEKAETIIQSVKEQEEPTKQFYNPYNPIKRVNKKSF